MFTGLIQMVGHIEQLRKVTGGARLNIRCGPWDPLLETGESIAVNGVCLTAAETGADLFGCDVLDETLHRTNLAAATANQPVNLERALAAGDRMGGHMVSGHVDGTATVKRVTTSGERRIITLGCAPEMTSLMVTKGSVACDGISLTIARLARDEFDVHLIPETLIRTSWQRLGPGRRVNIETDMIGKYVKRFLEPGGPGGKLTMDKLRDAGFLE